MKKAIFVFTRDLRLYDNKTLYKSLLDNDHVLPIFIFNPEQVDNNKYKSEKCIKFMCESLDDLDNDLRNYNSKLTYFYGKHSEIIDKILKNDKHIDGIYMNKDYSPYAKKREELIKKISENNNIKFCSEHDYFLIAPYVRNKENETYVKFTPFYKKAKNFYLYKK